MTDTSIEADEQAAFRAEARDFLSAHAEPTKEAGLWDLNFHTDPSEAAAL